MERGENQPQQDEAERTPTAISEPLGPPGSPPPPPPKRIAAAAEELVERGAFAAAADRPRCRAAAARPTGRAGRPSFGGVAARRHRRSVPTVPCCRRTGRARAAAQPRKDAHGANYREASSAKNSGKRGRASYVPANGPSRRPADRPAARRADPLAQAGRAASRRSSPTRPAWRRADADALERELREAALAIPGVSEARVAMTAAQPHRTLIAIGSGKGGVGKSTVAANLAVALARTGQEGRAGRRRRLRPVAADAARQRTPSRRPRTTG